MKSTHFTTKFSLLSQIRRRVITAALFGTALLLAQGCTIFAARDRSSVPTFISAIPTPLAESTNNGLPNKDACLTWYEKMDAAVAAAGTQDAGAHRLTGFPYLRLDRFAASFRDQARNEPQIMPALLRYASDLDAAARIAEITNLPHAWRAAMGVHDVAAVQAAIASCVQTMTHIDLATQAKQTAILNEWQVPAHYAAWKRTLGLYPLTSIPFFHGISLWQKSTEKIFAEAQKITVNTKTESSILRYAPMRDQKYSSDIERIFKTSLRDILGAPQLSELEWNALLSNNAPIFEIETQGEFDRIGEMRFDGNEKISVDTAKPTTYQRIGFTRIGDKTHVQLIYSVWFSARPNDGKGPFDLLAGQLDGVIVRVTLDQDGAPLLVDSIHSCGCYHLFFPTPRLMPRPPPRANMEWAFIPKMLPQLKAGQRIAVRLASATHYLTDIRAEGAGHISNISNTSDISDTSDISVQSVPYTMQNDSALLTLPVGPKEYKEHRSVFSANGLISGTERGERFLFWPMGILSPGAMRQWGTHATAFVGIRHFDDADLIDLRFKMVMTKL